MSKKKKIINGVILTIAAGGQIILAFVLYNPAGNQTLINIGWGMLMLSAIFGWLPIYTFRKKGGVKGGGYIRTTVLVDSGIYGTVRHPQYLAGVLMSIALPMISQHWVVVLFGVVAVVIYYLDTFDEEVDCIEKFGEAYKEYMAAVPRLNFILGIIRSLRSRRDQQ